MSNNFHESHWGQCLELLSHLCQYGEDILLVTGPSGIGKTVMRRELIRTEAANFVLHDLVATSDLTPEEITALLESGDDNPENRDSLLLIDDAEHLSLEIIALLLQLRQRVTMPLHIVLFATPELTEKISRSVMQEEFFEQVHTIEIEPLTLMELEAFLMHQLRNPHDNHDLKLNKAKYKKIHSSSNGIPGKALQIAKNILAGKPTEEQTTQRLSPFAVGVTVSFGILFCILAFMWPAAKNPAPITASLPMPQTEKIAANDLDAATMESASTMAPDPMPIPPPEPTPMPQPDPMPLPQEPEVTPPQPTLMPQPDVMLQQSKSTSKISDDEKIARLEKKLEALQAQLNNQQSARKASELKSKQVNSKSIAKPTVSKGRTLSFSKQESQILAFPSQNYTLQLLGSNSEKKVQNFIRDNNLNGRAYYYKGIHNGKAWYVVLAGNYANKFEAQQAIARLPYSLKKQHPWPRQYNKIHDSINARDK